jgi:hypothetical protein
VSVLALGAAGHKTCFGSSLVACTSVTVNLQLQKINLLDHASLIRRKGAAEVAVTLTLTTIV